MDAVVPDVVPSGLRILGYRAIQWGEGGVGALRDFPPGGPRSGGGAYDLSPVPGWKVFQGQSLSVAIGLKVVRTGTLFIPGFTVRYHEGWHHYSVHYAQAVLVCAPMDAWACAGD
jgi:hypothetical protein